MPKQSKKAGLPPGTLVYIGKERQEKVNIDVIDYTESQLQEIRPSAVEECLAFSGKPTVTWINVTGVHDTDVIEKIGKQFGLHSLVMEDIVNTKQRPKIEAYENCLFMVLKMLFFNEKNETRAEQVSLVLGRNFVISFQETERDVFEHVRQRIRQQGSIRKMGSDYLVYALIDAIVDNYFAILEKIGGTIENVENEIMKNPGKETMGRVHALKRDLIYLRKSVWPLREVISSMERGGSGLVKEHTAIYLRDVYDHTIRVIETIETFRDMVSGMVDVYLSSVSNRTNEVMKVLTIIATIFMPLTFIVGIYGMNFENMPELGWRWGYLAVWLTIMAVSLSMLAYFRKKKWV